MGMIKRILRQTSHKLMAKLGAQRNQLVLNNGELNGLIAQSMGNVVVDPIRHQASALDQFKSSTRTRRTKRIKKNRHKNSSIPEALLLAAKNYLPPVQFHHIHGPNAQLSKNKCVARRTQSFCHALVFSNRVILPNERVYIKVLEIAKGWSGTIRFGFTSVDPATLKYQMPKHVCPDMTNAGHTWARALADEVVRRNSVIHFSYNTNGFIHYGINNQDCGVFHANVNTSQNLWFIVDIYGLTGAVELIDPRIHNASSELDLSRYNDDELTLRSGVTGHNDRATMFKSTGAMDDLLSPAAGRSNKKKRSRKATRHPGALIYEQWPHEEGLLMATPLDFVAAHQQHHLNRPILPNLSSIVLPTVQQNIYSPMPSMLRATDSNSNSIAKPHTVVRPSNDSHDYYQIMTNHGHINEPHHQQQEHHHHHQTIRDAELVLATRAAAAAAAAAATGTLSQNVAPMMPATASSSALNSSLATEDQQANHIASVAGLRNASGDEQEIRQQLDSFHVSDKKAATAHKQHKQAGSKSTKSTTSATGAPPPIAVQRKRLQQQQQQHHHHQQQPAQINSLQTTNYKQRASEFSPRDNSSTAVAAAATTYYNTNSSSATSTAITPKSTKVSSSSASKQAKAAGRHSTKNLKSSPSFRDNNNNSPPSKDCPICFERPINCVLYQCGHMCTCYECGVKQWRTQSRTCPICRTVIKDVIKTYMS